VSHRAYADAPFPSSPGMTKKPENIASGSRPFLADCLKNSKFAARSKKVRCKEAKKIQDARS
jgi:hypothetical protein